MLKESKDEEFTPPPIHEQKEYVIAVNDQISFKFYKNNGFEMLGGGINLESGAGSRQDALALTSGVLFTVELDGKVKLPYLGKTELVGLTIRQAEAFLEDKYDDIFVQPFILLSVTNRRVIVSRGDGTSGVVTLSNNNISVLEALSMAGGISQRGKSRNIKVIRKTSTGSEIYKLDLSRTDGLEMAYMPVQANDIIYVEPRKQYLQGILTEIAPYLTLISTALAVYATSQILAK